MRNGLDKSCRGNQNTRFVVSSVFVRIVPFMGKCGKISQSGAGHRRQYGACTLHAGYLRLHTLTHNT